MIKDKNKMNILISINSKFIMPAMVMLASLFENNKVPIDVYMMYSDLNKNEILILKKHVKKWNNKLKLIKINKDLFKKLPLYKRLSKETYYRLILHEVLPINIKRILYLDVDIIVNKSIVNFYNQSLDNYFCIVCEDIAISRKDERLYKSLGINKNEKYFNAGVILYNLDLFRENIKVKDIFKFAYERGEKLKYHDQDILNYFLKNKVKFEDYKIYNMTSLGMKQNKLKYKFIYDNTVIIHYAGLLKPWNSDYGNEPFGELFWKYTKKTPYRYSHPLLRVKSYVYKLLNWY